MMTKNYKLFANLCESVIFEASTLKDILPKGPAADHLIRYLHQKENLQADQKYAKIQSINWSDVKDSKYGFWIILKFNNGIGAIKVLPSKRGYTVLGASTESGEIEKDTVSRGDAVMSFFKQLGLKRIEELYQGQDYGIVQDKLTQRNQTKVDLAKLKTSSVSQLVDKFKPLWLKTLQLAKADIKGMVSTMIQNDSFNKAEFKLTRLKMIDNAINAITSGEDWDRSRGSFDLFKDAVNTAVIMTASHYYPEQTGEINRRYGSITPSDHTGILQVLKDIGQGDQKKLATVLGFFKRQMISG